MRVASAVVVIAALAAVLPAASSRLTQSASAAPAPMVLTYNTAYGGSTLSLPLSGGSVTVNWGDGTVNTSLTHTYASAGSQTVSISGTATHYGNVNGYTGNMGITAVASFGDLGMTDLSGAFDGASHLTSAPAALPPGATNLNHMFAGATAFNQPIGTWNTASVTDMAGMFTNGFGPPTAFDQPIGTWNTGAVTDMAGMFAGATAFNQPIGTWNTASVTDMAGMFAGSSAFNQPIGGWDTASVTSMNSMFGQTSIDTCCEPAQALNASAFNQPIGNWNTAAVTDMGGMFWGASTFNQPIGSWNTARVANMSNMFHGASVFNQPIRTWNTSALGGGMDFMFDGASRFNQPIGSWNTARVTSMEAVFSDASRFNQPIGSWNTGAVTDMADMFSGASRFNQPIGSWNTQRVTYMYLMFEGATAFNQPIGSWKTAAAASMDGMFWGASTFNQPIGSWNTAKVTDMYHMFDGAVRFNQPIGTWNTAHVTNMINMFGSGSHLSTSNYNQLLIGWAARPQIHHVHFGAGSSTYNGAAAAAHNTLRVTEGWTIVDGGRTSRRAVPQIIRPPHIAPFTYGRTITSASLVDGAANAPGRFFLTRSPLLLSAGLHRLTVIFRPAHSAHYTTTTTTILVRVNPRHLTLRLTGLTTTAHAHSVMVTVQNTVAGARVTVRWQQGAGRAVARTVIAAGTTARMGLLLPTAGVYQVIASATKPNYIFTPAHGSVTAT
jgi:surface protein